MCSAAFFQQVLLMVVGGVCACLVLPAAVVGLAKAAMPMRQPGRIAQGEHSSKAAAAEECPEKSSEAQLPPLLIMRCSAFGPILLLLPCVTLCLKWTLCPN